MATAAQPAAVWDFQADWSRATMTAMIMWLLWISQSVKDGRQKNCWKGSGRNSPCSHPNGSDCQDRLTTKLVNVEEGRNGSK